MNKSIKSSRKDFAFSIEYNDILRFSRSVPVDQQWKKAGDRIQKFSLHKRYPTSTSSGTIVFFD